MSLIKVKSSHNFEESVLKLTTTIEEKGLKVFATIKHGQAAKVNGLELNPTDLIIFGNPQVGTKLMNCDQTMGLELPMKILVWEDDSGQVTAGFNDPEDYLKSYDIESCSEVIAKVKGVLNGLISTLK
ncbi:MAG: DUF302 domain-containing protein [Bacteroidota bacterium]